jgi:exopolyphosphatase/guanosine-5'-triphosphate,3'-diphosphate pyrophosphatase
MKKISVIDVGTNTVLLLIASKNEKGEIFPVKTAQRITRLGEGVDSRGYLNKEAMLRTFNAVLEFYWKSFGKVQNIIICGTSALRDAKNRREFTEKIKEEIGPPLEILSPEEEAKWTFYGAFVNKNEIKENTVVMDIGGGSTEFVVGSKNEISNLVSINIGSVRLTERFIKNDPPPEKELREVKKFVLQEIEKSTKDFPKKLSMLVGVAGTVTTISAVNLKMEIYNPDVIHGYEMTIKDIEKLIKKFSKRNNEERKKLPGLEPKRADVITAGAIILHSAMEYFKFEKITVSDRGLRYGIAQRELNIP